MRYRKAIRPLLYVVLALSVLGVGAFVLGGGFFRWGSVCGVCGAERDSIERFWVFRAHRVKPTPLSEFVLREGIQIAHQHNWLFAHGGGAGVKCAIGPGRHLWGIIRDSDFQRFLVAVKKYHGLEESRRWLSIGLDPKRAFTVRYSFRPDADALKDKESFDRWLDEEVTTWREFENTKSDQSSGPPTQPPNAPPPRLPR
jgi:hypothetical protein